MTNTSIAALKRSKSNLDTLVSELSKVAEPQKQKNSYADDRWCHKMYRCKIETVIIGYYSLR